jgi:hypothetical protein
MGVTQIKKSFLLLSQVSLGFDHLVVVTTAQCHIYTTKNWNTPGIYLTHITFPHCPPFERFFG